ncbi:hypothetical protein FNV43_RR05654 [Rhamnella rubrinervis]|uniref:Uncharacterized protein n=1 Tax=Rhamnella rubrinervis TaxID=2594499 RepID=A0A8K0HLP5_9ROSA|nr:hypothetical protein FNV43_RR05654 [Rhamnella rubrinervis]
MRHSGQDIAMYALVFRHYQPGWSQYRLVDIVGVDKGNASGGVLARLGGVKAIQISSTYLHFPHSLSFLFRKWRSSVVWVLGGSISLGLYAEWDDLSWLTKGASVRGEQVVLSDSKLEVEIVGVVAGSGVPTGVEGDDVVMVNGPTRTSLESVNYELKDLLSIIYEEVQWLRRFYEIP